MCIERRTVSLPVVPGVKMREEDTADALEGGGVVLGAPAVPF